MLLAIDTSGVTGSLALGRWDGASIRILVQAELPGKIFAAQLVPRIRELLEQQPATVQDLNAVVIVNGPGSFTGVRIGVGAAKGLAEALQIPVIALSRLALLARKAGIQAAALDAGRGEYYFGHFGRGQSVEALLSAENLREQQPFAVCEPALANLWPTALLVPAPDAADALEAAVPRLSAGDYDDVAALDGNYLRRSDTELFARPAGVQK
jgi:tRNA threonylcarbamoyladenosine biosynthesis protein TsaB